MHRLQERATVLTRRIGLESQAQQDADELRILGEAPREPDRGSDELGLSDRPTRRAPLGGPAAATSLGD